MHLRVNHPPKFPFHSLVPRRTPKISLVRPPHPSDCRINISPSPSLAFNQEVARTLAIITDRASQTYYSHFRRRGPPSCCERMRGVGGWSPDRQTAGRDVWLWSAAAMTYDGTWVLLVYGGESGGGPYGKWGVFLFFEGAMKRGFCDTKALFCPLCIMLTLTLGEAKFFIK